MSRGTDEPCASCPGCGHDPHPGKRCTGWLTLENGRIGCQCWVERKRLDLDALHVDSFRLDDAGYGKCECCTHEDWLEGGYCVDCGPVEEVHDYRRADV